jgi:hypothetical protein
LYSITYKSTVIPIIRNAITIGITKSTRTGIGGIRRAKITSISYIVAISIKIICAVNTNIASITKAIAISIELRGIYSKWAIIRPVRNCACCIRESCITNAVSICIVTRITCITYAIAIIIRLDSVTYKWTVIPIIRNAITVGIGEYCGTVIKRIGRTKITGIRNTI